MEKEEGELEACLAAGQHIVSYQKGLQQFTQCLASCYTKYDNNHPEVIKMRTQIVRNTLLYRELHLRASKEFIAGLGEVMRYFTDLSEAEFAEYIEDVAEAAASYKNKAQLVQDLHIHLHSDTRNLADEAQATAKKLNLDAEIYNEDAVRLANKQERYKKKADFALCASVVMHFASVTAAAPILGVSLVGLIPACGAFMYADHQVSKVTQLSSDSLVAVHNSKNAALAAEEIAGRMYDCVIHPPCDFPSNKVLQHYQRPTREIQTSG